MTTKANTQIQIRIDSKTKKEAKAVLENIGMDISTAVKVLLKQIIWTGSFPVELRDANGFRAHKAKELREAIADTKKGKTFSNIKELMADLEC